MKALLASDVTGLLRAWNAGDEQVMAKLMEAMYHDLRRAAHRYMLGEKPGHPLQTTALIHEVYLRLVDIRERNFENRVHFFAMCARLMRRILVDFARSQGYRKRGGGAPHVSLDETLQLSRRPDPALIALDDALEHLSAVDPRKSQVIELRFFGGLSVQETAAALHVSEETVMRDWKLAKSWLKREMSRKEQHDNS
jgi:RNA polymerase sigma-70 factor (ECF subfamily)